jgi:hypothetical protein
VAVGEVYVMVHCGTRASSLLLLLLGVACSRSVKPASDADGVTASNNARMCTKEAFAGLHVDVVTPEGAPICNAQVQIVGQGKTEQLDRTPTEFGGDVACEYYGAEEWNGTFRITAKAPGFQSATLERVDVQRSVCHVIPRFVSVTLQPE